MFIKILGKRVFFVCFKMRLVFFFLGNNKRIKIIFVEIKVLRMSKLILEFLLFRIVRIKSMGMVVIFWKIKIFIAFLFMGVLSCLESLKNFSIIVVEESESFMFKIREKMGERFKIKYFIKKVIKAYKMICKSLKISIFCLMDLSLLKLNLMFIINIKKMILNLLILDNKLKLLILKKVVKIVFV